MDPQRTLLTEIAEKHMAEWLSEPTPFPGTIEAATNHSYYRFENGICMEKADRMRKVRLRAVGSDTEIPYSDLDSEKAIGCMLVGFVLKDSKGVGSFSRKWQPGASAVLLVSDASGHKRAITVTTGVVYFVEPEASVIPPPPESGLRLVRQPKSVPSPTSVTRIHVASR